MAGVGAGVAQAQAPGTRETPRIAAPAGWKLDAALSAQLTLVLRKEPRPNQSGAMTEAFRAPAGGAVLYATRIELKVPAAQRDAVATVEVGEPAAALRRHGGKAIVELSAQRADVAAKQLEANVTWRDPEAGILDLTRTIVAADAEHVVAITGQCVLGTGAPADLVAVCGAALATIDPGIPPAQRVPLAITAQPEAAAAPATSAASGATGAPAKSGDTPTLGDGSRIPLPPRVVSQQPAAQQEDRRMIYAGIGLVVIAIVFWWNRRRRERFEADDDADDLHAAAAEPEKSEKSDEKEKEV